MESAAKRYGLGILDTSSYPVCLAVGFGQDFDHNDPECIIKFLEDRCVIGIVDELCKAYYKVRAKERELVNNKVATTLIIDHMSDMIGGSFFTQPSPSTSRPPHVNSLHGIQQPTHEHMQNVDNSNPVLHEVINNVHDCERV